MREDIDRLADCELARNAEGGSPGELGQPRLLLGELLCRPGIAGQPDTELITEPKEHIGRARRSEPVESTIGPLWKLRRNQRLHHRSFDGPVVGMHPRVRHPVPRRRTEATLVTEAPHTRLR